MKENWQQAHFQESYGEQGHRGVEINILLPIPRELTDAEKMAMYKAADIIEAATMRESIRQNPVEMANAAEERRQLLALFHEPIFVEELPNGYCGRYCCAHRPWFKVTTSVGRIIIGWRKRVISIDWSESTMSPTPGERMKRR